MPLAREIGGIDDLTPHKKPREAIDRAIGDIRVNQILPKDLVAIAEMLEVRRALPRMISGLPPRTRNVDFPAVKSGKYAKIEAQTGLFAGYVGSAGEALAIGAPGPK